MGFPSALGCVAFAFFSLANGAPGITAYRENCFDTNTDYPGYDVALFTPELPYPGKVLLTAKDCQDVCAQTDGCKYFTWSSSNQRCYLKHLKSVASYEVGAISGPKFCAGVKHEPTEEDLQAAFRLVDKDQNGKLTKKETREFFKALDNNEALDMSETEGNWNVKTDYAIKNLDTDGDKMLSMDELISSFNDENEDEHNEVEEEEEFVRELINTYDADGNGKLNKDEFGQLMKAFDVGQDAMDTVGLERYLVHLDKNGDRQIDLKEFTVMYE